VQDKRKLNIPHGPRNGFKVKARHRVTLLGSIELTTLAEMVPENGLGQYVLPTAIST
jgi:hypothetical protein